MRFFSIPFPARALVLASLVALGACSSKNYDVTPTPSTPTYGMSWSADGKDVTVATPSYSLTNGSLLLTGLYAESNGDTYSIALNVPASTGTYNLSGSNTTTTQVASYQTFISNVSNAYVASSALGTGSGTITISTFTADNIGGTFNFTGVSSANASARKTVGNGKFYIKR